MTDRSDECRGCQSPAPCPAMLVRAPPVWSLCQSAIFLLRHPLDWNASALFMARPRSVTLEVNITPTQAIRALRELVQLAGWEWERDEGSRLVDRMMVIMPIARATRTFRIAILSGEGRGLILTAWEEVAGSAGGITKAEWIVPGHLTGDPFRDLLRSWCSRQPKCPWRWSFAQRSMIGFLLPVWRRSPREFRKFGLDTSKKGWPVEANWPPVGWPDAREEE